MSDLVFVDMVSNVTAVIKAPIDVVWPRLLEQAAWMKEFTIETVQGEPNREGQIKKVSAARGQPEFPQFFFKTMLLIPFRKFVYKAYTNERGGPFGFTGFEVLTLDDFGNESTVTFEAYLEVQSSTMTRQELSALVSAEREGSVAMWERNFERLASLIADCRK